MQQIKKQKRQEGKRRQESRQQSEFSIFACWVSDRGFQYAGTWWHLCIRHCNHYRGRRSRIIYHSDHPSQTRRELLLRQKGRQPWELFTVLLYSQCPWLSNPHGHNLWTVLVFVNMYGKLHIHLVTVQKPNKLIVSQVKSNTHGAAITHLHEWKGWRLWGTIKQCHSLPALHSPRFSPG